MSSDIGRVNGELIEGAAKGAYVSKLSRTHWFAITSLSWCDIRGMELGCLIRFQQINHPLELLWIRWKSISKYESLSVIFFVVREFGVGVP